MNGNSEESKPTKNELILTVQELNRECVRLSTELANARNAALEDAIDAIDEYRETIPTDKFGPKAWPTVGGIKDAIRRALKAEGESR
jgi:hypothetical protein